MALVIESLFYLKLSVGIHHIVYRYKAWPIFLTFYFVEVLSREGMPGMNAIPNGYSLSEKACSHRACTCSWTRTVGDGFWTTA
jgi:hypothetical protein